MVVEVRGSLIKAKDDPFTLGMKKLMYDLTVEFSIYATERGWPEEIAKSISFNWADKEGIKVGKSMPEAVYDDLEYGRPGVPPNPALSNFMSDHSVGRKLASAAMETVVEPVWERVDEEVGTWLDGFLGDMVQQRAPGLIDALGLE